MIYAVYEYGMCSCELCKKKAKKSGWGYGEIEWPSLWRRRRVRSA